MPSRKKRKWRPLIERARAAIAALPKYARSVIDDPEFLALNITREIEQGNARDPITGRKMGVKRVLQEYLKSPLRHSSSATLRGIFKRFREETPWTYSKYNSYVYRKGFSSANYFYENSSYKVSGSVIIVTTPLPRGNYSELEIEYDYSGEDFYSEMS